MFPLSSECTGYPDVYVRGRLRFAAPPDAREPTVSAHAFITLPWRPRQSDAHSIYLPPYRIPNLSPDHTTLCPLRVRHALFPYFTHTFDGCASRSDDRSHCISMLYETTCTDLTPSCAHYQTYLKITKKGGAAVKGDMSGSMASRAAA